MRKLLVAAAFAPAALFLTAAAPVQDILDTLTDKASELFKEKGFTPTGFKSDGSLAQGASKKVAVSLKGGDIYTIVGMCDGDCKDLNLRLIDSGGSEVDNDLEDDDFPVLAAKESGSYTISVEMKGCGSSACRYRLVAYRQ